MKKFIQQFLKPQSPVLRTDLDYDQAQGISRINMKMRDGQTHFLNLLPGVPSNAEKVPLSILLLMHDEMATKGKNTNPRIRAEGLVAAHRVIKSISQKDITNHVLDEKAHGVESVQAAM